MSILRKSKKKSLQPPNNILVGKAYPISGLFYVTEKGTFYVKALKRYKVFSDRCFQSWSVKPIYSSFDQISHIPYAGVLGFRDGTIIHNLADGKIYVVSDNKRLHIKDPDSFPDGWIRDNMITVNEQEANLHKDGQEINGN
jgi:hypothetical protein